MRKISFILIIAILTAMIPTVLSAQDLDSSSVYYDRCSEFLSQLGIIDEIEESYDSYVLREEFVAMIVRAMNYSDMSAPDGGFADVKESPFAKEINVAKAIGITNGTSETMFSPKDNITSAAAQKMLVTALGYEAYAVAMGGYPAGYVSVASRLGLNDGTENSEILKYGDALVMIYNTLYADIALVDGITDEDISLVSQKGRNLMTENFKLTKLSGVVSTAGYISDSDLYVSKDAFEISGTVLKYDGDSDKYFGLSVDAWYDDSTKSVKAVWTADTNKQIVIEAEDVDLYSDYTLKAYESDTKVKSHKMDKAFSFIKNGRIIAHTNDSFIIDSGSFTLIDNDSDGLYEYVLASDREYFVISGINSSTETIYDSNSDIGSICFDTNEDYSYVIYMYDDEANEYSKANSNIFTQDMTLEVYMSDDKKVCRVYARPNYSIVGALSEISEDGFIIDGDEYKLNSYFQKINPNVNIGGSYTYLLAPDGTICDIREEGDRYIYGLVMGMGRENELDSRIQVKILNENNKIKVYNLDDKIKFNGEQIKSDSQLIEDAFLINGYPSYAIIRYMVSDDIIKSVDTAKEQLDDWSNIDANTGDDSLTRYAKQKLIRYKSSGKVAMPGFILEGTKVFAVPQALMNPSGGYMDDESFYVTTASSLRNDGLYTLDAYDFTPNFTAKAAVVYIDKVESTTPQRGGTSHMVCDITDAATSDGEITKKLKVFSNGKFKSYYLDPDSVSDIMNANPTLSIGDVVRLSFDITENINGLSIDVDYEKGQKLKINYGANYIENTPNAVLTYMSGSVIDQSDGILLLRTETAPSAETAMDYVSGMAPIPLLNATYTVFNTSTDEVKAGRASDIVSANASDINDASYVAIRISYFTTSQVFIYTK